MSEQTRDRGVMPGLIERLKELVPGENFRRGAAVVPVVRLVRRDRRGGRRLAAGHVAGGRRQNTLERAFAVRNAKGGSRW